MQATDKIIVERVFNTRCPLSHFCVALGLSVHKVRQNTSKRKTTRSFTQTFPAIFAESVFAGIRFDAESRPSAKSNRLATENWTRRLGPQPALGSAEICFLRGFQPYSSSAYSPRGRSIRPEKKIAFISNFSVPGYVPRKTGLSAINTTAPPPMRCATTDGVPLISS